MDKTCVLILLIVATVSAQLDIPADQCQCWVPTYKRAPCNVYSPNMGRTQCEGMGCCYHESGQMNTPTCYRRTAQCPPRQCLIPASERSVCITANLGPNRCLNGQCCYDGGSAPHCYRPIGGQPVPAYDTSLRLSMFSNGNENTPFSPKGYLHHGNAMLVVGGCATAVIPCGTSKTNRDQCSRFMCCWIPSRRLPSGQACFTSVYNFIKFPFAKWDNWGEWTTCTASACGTGTQTRTRTCIDGQVGQNGCEGSETDTQACQGSCTISWGAWAQWSTCQSAEPTCTSGTRSRSRVCVNQAGVTQANTACTTGAASESETCNAQLCPAYTQWAGSCSVTCGGGIQNRARTCTTTPTGPIPSSCTTIAGQACNTQSCNKDLDIMFIVDSSQQLDSCSAKEASLGQVAPFTPAGGLLTTANFPNFVQQKTFLTSFFSIYKTVVAGRTNVGVLSRSGSCAAATSTNYHKIKALSDTYVPLQAEAAISYLCGFPDFFSTLGCGIEYIKTGNTNNPDVIVEILPDITTLSSTLLQVYQNNVASINTIAGATRVLTVTAADLSLSSMTQANIDANVLFGKQWACRSTTPPATCIYYLGTVYNPAQVIANFILATADL
nr:SCO-spondin [Ciona intestinalis]|eukprot:XP_002128724.1 SCO-spondin [Ciona intestinalis]